MLPENCSHLEDTSALSTNCFRPNNRTEPTAPLDNSPLISGFIRDLFFGINFVFLSFSISLFGTVNNVINVVIFYKMGFQETLNISLFALAVSDFCSLVTLLLVCVLTNPVLYNDSTLPFLPDALILLVAGWPHVAFARVTAWITVFVTFERFFCIAKPLKVKSILTGRRVAAINISIFVLVLACISPTYYAHRLAWVPGSDNRTILGLYFTDDRDEVNAVTVAFNSVVSPMVSFGFVVVFTLFLVSHLNRKSQWRQKSVANVSETNVGAKDQKVVKMMVIVATIFIVCAFPNLVGMLYHAVEPKFSITGKYRNIYSVCYSFTFLFESLNSSINIFVYYSMSSKYKKAFSELFSRKEKE